MPITKATLADAAELANLVNSAYRGASSQKGWTSEAHLLGGIRIDEPTIFSSWYGSSFHNGWETAANYVS